ncbi:hypothetical protein B0J11DRAFT_505055 [Dendryphion nanum]|uniref:Uncharacterized protein n=1 Tax=Dendryphion nanum TaxID=256645 RepID=A0A9P9E0E6_9PLEO|nr:hypothetical protein B0J11DRAFT_505055 [Dendryphion nanum]
MAILQTLFAASNAAPLKPALGDTVDTKEATAIAYTHTVPVPEFPTIPPHPRQFDPWNPSVTKAWINPTISTRPVETPAVDFPTTGWTYPTIPSAQMIPPNQAKHEGHDWKAGAITVGIVVGTIFAVSLLCCTIWWVYRRCTGKAMEGAPNQVTPKDPNGGAGR